MDSRVSCPDLRPSTAAAGPPVLRSADAHRLAGLVRDGKPQGPVTVVVVPSVTLDPAELRRIPGSVHFEHRLLFTLRYLRDPQVRVVYVTSGPLERAAVDYTLRILCGAQADAAAARLTLIDCDDAGDDAVALTHRVLARQAVQERILACPDVPDRAYLLTFTTTPAERFLADRLGLPLYGCDPELAPLGTKTGSRRLFAEAGVPVAEGRDGIRNRAGLVAALAGLVPPGAGPASVVVKLDDSFAGLGNAVVALPAVPPTADFDWYERQVVAGVCFADGELTWPRFLDAVDRRGCVVERLVESPARLAPSAQLE
ncbi:MAG TPA: hypothetical protein VI248_07520, partial [Kineosporiaceae bacterium]